MAEHFPSRARARTRLKFGSAIFALIASAACAPQGGTPGLVRPQDGIPGPPEAMPGQMDDYVQQIDFGAGADPGGIFEGPMKCGMPAKCGGQTEVHIRVVPSNYATTADWQKALNNGNGYVVAKVSNMDAVPFDRLNLAAYEVGYVWVGSNQGSARTAAIYAVRNGNVRRIFTFKGLKFCKDSTPQKPAVHIYSPSKCTGTLSATSFTGGIQQASVEPFSAIGSYLLTKLATTLVPGGLDGLWISCSYGCCEAQFDGA
jgi:hypothetical protein